MELTKERMLDIVKRQRECDFCLSPEPCDECERGVNTTNNELWQFYDKIIELLQADADGRCVVLPCKVGTTVYSVHSAGLSKPVIAELEIDLFFLVLAFCEGRFGKTVFLTREEAIAALPLARGKPPMGSGVERRCGRSVKFYFVERQCAAVNG